MLIYALFAFLMGCFAFSMAWFSALGRADAWSARTRGIAVGAFVVAGTTFWSVALSHALRLGGFQLAGRFAARLTLPMLLLTVILLVAAIVHTRRAQRCQRNDDGPRGS